MTSLAALSDEYILPSPKHDTFMSSPLVYHDTVNMSKGKSIFDAISVSSENNNTINKLTKEGDSQSVSSNNNQNLSTTIIESDAGAEEKKNS